MGKKINKHDMLVLIFEYIGLDFSEGQYVITENKDGSKQYQRKFGDVLWEHRSPTEIVFKPNFMKHLVIKLFSLGYSDMEIKEIVFDMVTKYSTDIERQLFYFLKLNES